MTALGLGNIPPCFGRDFLDWLRVATERAWAQMTEATLADYQHAGIGGAGWRRGTRWKGGLSDAQIDDAEQRFGLHFPPEHRLFLGVLHATTPKRRGAGFIDDHRYLLDAEPYPVLSVHQSDIIVYGSDLRSFLLHELQAMLGLEGDPRWMNADVNGVPFWGEIVS